MDLSEPEILRIRKHLAQVEADLRTHTPSGLSAIQLEARRRRLDELHDYRVRGEFPRNPDYPDSLVPYFIDAGGVACAVGHLVIASGHREFAEEIARTQNHAYIRDISDPRLAEWAKAAGLTLEECARIQPGYGLPGSIEWSYIRELKVGPEGTVWTLASIGDCLCTTEYQTFSLKPGGTWIRSFPDQSGQNMLCLDPKGSPMIGINGDRNTGGLLWNGRRITASGNFEARACAWSADGKVAWVTGNLGLWVYNSSGSSLISAPVVRDSIPVVATSRMNVWAGSSHGVIGSEVHSSIDLTHIDTAGMPSPRVTGLEGQGDVGLWAGVDGDLGVEYRWYGLSRGEMPVFSRKGLLFRNGYNGGWTVYHRSNAALPSDTIRALTVADNQSVWIAVDSGIYRFTPPDRIVKARGSFDAPVTAMAGGSEGELYIGTWGRGVFRYVDGNTRSLGSYVVSVRPGKSFLGPGNSGGPNRMKEASTIYRSVSGRKLDLSERKTDMFLVEER